MLTIHRGAVRISLHLYSYLDLAVLCSSVLSCISYPAMPDRNTKREGAILLSVSTLLAS